MLLVKVNALAPELKVMPDTNMPEEKVLFNTAPAPPAAPNIHESPLMGGLLAPVQLGSARLAEVLPTHVSGPFWADARGAARIATLASTAIPVEMILLLIWIIWVFIKIKSG